MEWVETTGRTVEEALDAALDELGVDEHDVEYEVLVEPRGGLFKRFGASEARVRARVKPLSREKPGDRRRRGRRNRVSSDASPPERVAEASADQRDAAPRREPATRPAPARRRRRRQPTNGSGGQQLQEQGVSVDNEPLVPIEEQAEQAEAFTRGLIEAFGAKAEVTGRVEDEDDVQVDVTGENLGLLVGPRGATLGAIEELVRTVVQRQTGGHSARVHVDVGGYRAKRREALTVFTRQLAQRVIDEGGEQALEPMSAPDRKVVHDVVAEIDGVTTVSEGEEPRRRVVIRRV